MMIRFCFSIVLLSTSLIVVAESRIESELFTGTPSEYIKEYQNCISSSNKKLVQGEYETKSEFEQRKTNANVSCDKFNKAKFITNWNLRYNVDGQYFYLDIPKNEYLPINVESLFKKVPLNLELTKNEKQKCYDGGYNYCSADRQLSFKLPKYKVYGETINRVSFHISGERHYLSNHYGKISSFRPHSEKVNVEPTRIYVNVRNARNLKGKEVDLELHFTGSIESSKSGKWGVELKVKRIDIHDLSIGKNLLSIKKAV